MSPSDETSVSPPTSTQTSQTFHTNMMQSKPSKPSSLPPLNLWCDLPLEIGSIICEYLDVDYCGYLFMISKTWSILPTKKVYHQHCLAIFLSQTFKKIMNISYWGTWKKMLIDRPRLRTNGIYSLRTSFWKPPVNDRFWEEKIREFHEVKFYRHFRFFNDEKVLYSLCNTSCYDIHPQLQYYQGNPAKKIYEGTYQLTRDVVIVKIPTHYAEITFIFLIRNLSASEEGGSDDSYAGHHNLLKLTQHSANIIRQNQSTHVQYDLPAYSNFLFHRFWL